MALHVAGNQADSRTIRQGDQQQVPYQWVLRALGAELDARGARQILLLEGSDGFWVRFVGPDAEQGLQLLQLSYEELLGRTRTLEGQRSPRTRFTKKERLPGGYQDVLRALGYELEQASAYSILVDEQEENVLVTYQYLNSADGYLARLRILVVDPSLQEVLLQQARTRRRPQKGRLLPL